MTEEMSQFIKPEGHDYLKQTDQNAATDQIIDTPEAVTSAEQMVQTGLSREAALILAENMLKAGYAYQVIYVALAEADGTSPVSNQEVRDLKGRMIKDGRLAAS